MVLSMLAHGAAAMYWFSGDHRDPGREAPAVLQIAVHRPVASTAEPVQPLPEPIPVPARRPVKEVRPEAPLPVERGEPEPPRPPAESASRAPVPPAEIVVAASEPASEEVAPAPRPTVDLVALRHAYEARLLRHIESYKFYPAAARRRRLEGGVPVTLRVGCDGELLAVSASRGASLLRRAAEQSVDGARPLPRPDAMLGCPRSVEFVMRYRLRS